MKLLANLGDADPLEYGGLLVLEGDMGATDGGAHIEVWDEPDTMSGDDEDAMITIYSVDIEKFTYIDGVLSGNPYHPDHPVWFADKLEHINGDEGAVDQTINWFLSDDPVERAMGYREVASYYGWHEFDQYPLTMSVGKAAWRYRELNLGTVPYKYKLLDQIRQFCRVELDRLIKADPTDDLYWIAHRGGETYAYNHVMIELNRIEYSWK